MYKLQVNLPNQAEGAEVELEGLGIFKNGETHEISEPDALAFSARHVERVAQFAEDPDDPDAEHEVVGYALVAPAFEDLVDKMYGVTLVKDKEGEDQ